MLRAAEIAAAHPRALACLVMAPRIWPRSCTAHTPLRLPLLTALGLCLPRAPAALRSWTASIDLEDDAGFAACRQGAELGFDGKTLIHPKQIGPANEAFAPDAETLARARIIEAHEQAARDGQGVVVVDGNWSSTCTWSKRGVRCTSPRRSPPMPR